MGGVCSRLWFWACRQCPPPHASLPPNILLYKDTICFGSGPSSWPHVSLSLSVKTSLQVRSLLCSPGQDSTSSFFGEGELYPTRGPIPPPCWQKAGMLDFLRGMGRASVWCSEGICEVASIVQWGERGGWGPTGCLCEGPDRVSEMGKGVLCIGTSASQCPEARRGASHWGAGPGGVHWLGLQGGALRTQGGVWMGPGGDGP